MLRQNSQDNLESKLTLIIPTRNKPNFLLALLQYYNEVKFPFNILVIDDSDNLKNKKLFKARLSNFSNLNLEYRDTQFKNLFEALLFALQNTKTPYVLNSGDDDYYSVSMINKMINFLDNNLDYISTSGLSVKMNAKWDERTTKWQVISLLNATTNSYDAKNAQERLELLLKKYKVITYSVVRTKALKNAYEIGRSNDMYKFPALIELFQNAFLLINGKHKRFLGFFHFWFAPIERRTLSHRTEIKDFRSSDWFSKFNLENSNKVNLVFAKVLKDCLDKQHCSDSDRLSVAIWMSYHLNYLLRRHKEYLLTCSNFRKKNIHSRVLYKFFVLISFRMVRSNPQEMLEKFWSNLYFYCVSKLFLLFGKFKFNPSGKIINILNQTTQNKLQ